jgi:hypothetical protein
MDTDGAARRAMRVVKHAKTVNLRMNIEFPPLLGGYTCCMDQTAQSGQHISLRMSSLGDWGISAYGRNRHRYEARECSDRMLTAGYEMLEAE